MARPTVPNARPEGFFCNTICRDLDSIPIALPPPLESLPVGLHANYMVFPENKLPWVEKIRCVPKLVRENSEHGVCRHLDKLRRRIDDRPVLHTPRKMSGCVVKS